MAKNDSETPGQGPDLKEAVSTTNQSSGSRLNSAIQAFIEKKYQNEGEGFYQKFTEDSQAGRAGLVKEFEIFSLREGNTFGKKTFENLRNSDTLDMAVRRICLEFENRKRLLRSAISSEFNLSEKRFGEAKREMQREINRLSPRELERLLRSQSEREKFLARFFKKTEIGTIRRTFVEYVEALDLGELTTEQRERLWEFRDSFRSMSVTESDLGGFLSCLGNSYTKRRFIKAFLPNVSLGTLVREDVLAEREAREIFTNYVKKSGQYRKIFPLKSQSETWKEERSKDKKDREDTIREAVERIDLDTVRIPSSELKSGQIERILDTEPLRVAVASELERGFRELKEVVAGEFEIEEDSTTGKFVPAYVAKLQEHLKDAEGKETIEHFKILEDFLLEGKEPPPVVHLNEGYDPMNGQPKMDVQFRIVGISDSKNPAERRVKLENLTPKGENVSAEPYSLSYADFYKLLSSLKGARVFSEEDWANELRKGERYLRDENGEILTRDENGKEFIASLDELNAKLDELTDPEGVGRAIAAGRSFMIGKPGEAHFNVGTVVGVDEVSKKITVRNTLGTEQSFSYAEFFQIFIETEGKRLEPSASSVDGVLKLQAGGKRWKEFAELSVVDGKIVPEDRKNEKTYPGIRYFVGSGGRGIEIGEIRDGQVELREMKNFEEGDGKNPPKADFLGALTFYPAETFHLLLEKCGGTPFELVNEKEIEKREVADVEFKSQGFIKRFFHHASIHDIMKGMGRIPEFIKHKLEHGSKHHSAHVALAVAKKIPFFPEDWLVDLRGDIENEDKKSLTEEVERLNNLASPERRKQVERYLFDKGTEDYQMIAGVLSLLEKHGNLYPGAPLSQYEGSWLFFRRMPGENHEKEIFLQNLRKKVWKDERIEVTEEYAIQEWLKELAKHKHINQLYWVMVKKSWYTGSESECDMGKKEAEGKATFEGRSRYALSKIRDHEFAHGAGAMEVMWDKEGPLKDRLKLPFVLAMGNARNSMHPKILQKFTKMFNDGHPYPPLVFIQKADKQEVFRNVVGALVESSGNGAMQSAYLKLKSDFKSENSDNLTNNCADFWDTYGAYLHRKLLLSVDDPEIFARAQDSSDPNQEDFAAYVETTREEFSKSNILGTEDDIDMYTVEKANWALTNPKSYVGKFKINSGNAGFNSKLESNMFDSFAESVEKIRSAQPFKASEGASTVEKAAIDEKNRIARKALYRRMHYAFLRYIHETLSADKWGEDTTKALLPNGKHPLKLEGETYMQKMAQYGFSVAPDKNIDRHFTGKAYEDWLNRDFSAFELGVGIPKGNERTADATRNDTAVTAEMILRWASRAPAANEGRSRKAA